MSASLSSKGLQVSKRTGRTKTGVGVDGGGINVNVSIGPLSVKVKPNGTIEGKIGVGGLSVSADNKGGFGAEALGFGIDYNSDGSGGIYGPLGIAKMEVEKQGCTYIKRTYIAGTLIDTEYQQIKDCKEPDDPPDPEPPPIDNDFGPEPPPPELPPIPKGYTGWICPVRKITRSGTSIYGIHLTVSGSASKYQDQPWPPRKETELKWLVAGKIETKTLPYQQNLKGDFGLDYTAFGPDESFAFGAFYSWVQNPWINSVTALGQNTATNLEGNPGQYRSIHYMQTSPYSWYYIGEQFPTERQQQIDAGVSPLHFQVPCPGSGCYYVTNYQPTDNTITPPKPTMANCCKESKVDLARLEQKLDMLLQVTEAEPLTKKGYTIPASLIAFGADKGKLEIKSIPAYLQYIMREIDHYGISPIKINIKDIDPTQEGDQGLAEQYVNGTAAIKRILELLHGQKGTDKLRLNLQARIASMLDMILASVTSINELLESITVYIDMPLKEIKEKYMQPWDPYIGLKGFAQKQAWEKELNKKLKADMEKNIAEMCNDSERTVVVKKFNGKADRLIQLIQKLLVGMKNG